MEKTKQTTKLFNFRLILFITLSYIVGISAVYFLAFSKIFWAIFSTLAFIFCILIYLFIFTEKEKRRVGAIFSAVFLLFFLLGGLNFHIRLENYQKASLGGGYYTVTGKVVEVKETASGKRYLMKNSEISGKKNGILRYKVALFVNGESEYDIGDYLKFDCYLSDKTGIYEDKFSSYEVVDKIKYTASVGADEIEFVKNDKTVFEKVNIFIRENLKKGLSEVNFPVAYAMLTGNSEYMDAEVLSAYRQAGVAHIFAVSGLHIGFVAVVLNFLFDKIRLNRIIKAVLITAILLFYSGVCGFSASSLRATYMSAILLFAAIGGDKYDKFVSVSTAALVVLMTSPVQLFCAGFQLSFVVVTFMLLLSNPLAKLFKFLPRKIASSLGAVISAQLAGIPVCLASFGEFSLIAIVANLLFIPLVGVIFISLILGVLVGALFSIQAVALFLPNLALFVVNAVITAFDYRIFIVGGFTLGGFIILYYFSLVTASGFINLKAKVKAITSITLAVVCALGTVGLSVYYKNSTYVYALGSDSVCATLVRDKKENYLIVSHLERGFNLTRLSRLASKRGEVLDGVIILGEVDALNAVSGLREVFTVNKVYYYGSQNQVMDRALLLSFPKLQVENYDENKWFGKNDISFSFNLGGKAVEFTVDGKKSVVFSGFNDEEVDYAGLKDEYYLAVYLDTVESLSNSVNAKKEISYRKSLHLKDAESGGNTRVLIS